MKKGLALVSSILITTHIVPHEGFLAALARIERVVLSLPGRGITNHELKTETTKGDSPKWSEAL